MADKNKPKIVHAHLAEEELYKTTLNAGRHELTGDEGRNVQGGKDAGPDPYDYLLMALGSCTVMTVKMYARHKEWPVEDIYIELRHNKKHNEDCENCDDKKSRIDFIEKELIVEGDLSEEQVDRLLEISQRCPVHRTLLGDIKIESSIEHR
ncbi:MAG TPA: OsmC family protein [Balneolaceae bacterium]|nr:OsmC family protein [Balneolaceae bacterium]